MGGSEDDGPPGRVTAIQLGSTMVSDEWDSPMRKGRVLSGLTPHKTRSVAESQPHFLRQGPSNHQIPRTGQRFYIVIKLSTFLGKELGQVVT